MPSRCPVASCGCPLPRQTLENVTYARRSWRLLPHTSKSHSLDILQAIRDVKTLPCQLRRTGYA